MRSVPDAPSHPEMLIAHTELILLSAEITRSPSVTLLPTLKKNTANKTPELQVQYCRQSHNSKHISGLLERP